MRSPPPRGQRKQSAAATASERLRNKENAVRALRAASARTPKPAGQAPLPPAEARHSGKFATMDSSMVAQFLVRPPLCLFCLFDIRTLTKSEKKSKSQNQI